MDINLCQVNYQYNSQGNNKDTLNNQVSNQDNNQGNNKVTLSNQEISPLVKETNQVQVSNKATVAVMI